MVLPVESAVAQMGGDGVAWPVQLELNPSHSALVLAQLWRQGLLTDVTLAVGDPAFSEHVACHKLVLSSHSAYFRTLFAGAWSTNGPVEVPEVPPETLKQLVTAFYTGSLCIDPDSLAGILHTASYLDCAGILEACTQYMRLSLGLSTCLPLLVLAARYGLLQLRAELVAYVCGKFSTLVNGMSSAAAAAAAAGGANNGTEAQGTSGAAPHGDNSKGDEDGNSSSSSLACLPQDLLCEVLSSDELVVDCESDVLQCIIGWLAADLEGRSSALPELAGAVRAELLPHQPRLYLHTPAHAAAWAQLQALQHPHPASHPHPHSQPGLPPSSHQPPAATTPSQAAAAAAIARAAISSADASGSRGVGQGTDIGPAGGVEGARMAPALANPAPIRAASPPSLTAASSEGQHNHFQHSQQPHHTLPCSMSAESHDLLPSASSPVPAPYHTLSIAAAAGTPFGAPASSSFLPYASLSFAPSSSPGAHSHPEGAGPHTSSSLSGPMHAFAPASSSHSAAASRSAGGSTSGRGRRHMATCLIALGGHDASWRALKQTEIYDPVRDVWVAGPPMQQGLSFAGCAMLPGSGVWAFGGTPLTSSVSRLRRSGPGGVVGTWEACPAPHTPRAHAGVVAVADMLFVLGGRSQVHQVQHVLNTVEVFSTSSSGLYHSHAGPGTAGPLALGLGPHSPPSSLLSCSYPPSSAAPNYMGAHMGAMNPMLTSTHQHINTSNGGGGSAGWRRMPDMIHARSALGCTALGGQVYAIGGAAAARGGTTHRSCEAFDVASETWRLLGAGLNVERKYTAAGALGGRVYVVGGVNEARVRLDSVEALDPREGRWQMVAPMSLPRSSCAVAALQGKLYVAGGQCSSSDAASTGGAASGFHGAGSFGNSGSFGAHNALAPMGALGSGASLGQGLGVLGGGEEGAVHHSCESFDPAMNKWVPVASLGSGRSGLALVGV